MRAVPRPVGEATWEGVDESAFPQAPIVYPQVRRSFQDAAVPPSNIGAKARETIRSDSVLDQS